MTRRKFSEVQMKRSVLKCLVKTEKETISGAGIGVDCARLLLSGNEGDTLFAADGLCLSGSLGLVKEDFLKLYNNVKAAGGIPCALTDTLMMPEDDERQVKTIIRELSLLAKEYDVAIVAGHTEISPVFQAPAVALTMLGFGKTVWNKKLLSGMDIVMSGFAGSLGTVKLVKEHKEGLLKRYSADYLRTAERMEAIIAIDTEVDIAIACDACYAHDISTGGVYAALWELADGANVGIRIFHDAIPIRQETIEICEFTGCNPYMVDGSGGVLFVTNDGKALSQALYEAGYEAAVIGQITEGKDRVILHQEERRFLTPPRGNER